MDGFFMVRLRKLIELDHRLIGWLSIRHLVNSIGVLLCVSIEHLDFLLGKLSNLSQKHCLLSDVLAILVVIEAAQKQ